MEFTEEQAPALSYWEDLVRVLKADTAMPAMPTIEAYRKMEKDEREAFDNTRVAYIGGRMTVNTPAVQNLIDAAGVVLKQNRHAPTGRRGILVSGPSTVGKTTACLSLMRQAYTDFGEQMPPEIVARAIPVAYVEVPPNCTPKGLLQRFADFYGLPYRPRTAANELKRQVVKAMRASLTQFVVVDELHNLAVRGIASGTSVDTLKDLSNSSPATFIYAGINIENSGLLSGARGDQVAQRFTPIRMKPLKNGREWKGIVKSFAKCLPLFANDPDELLRMSDRLHNLTGGNIGTLQSIITQTTHALIDAGAPEKETITPDMLSSALLDIRARSRHETGTVNRGAA